MKHLNFLMVFGICALSAGCLSFGEAGSESDRSGGFGVEEVKVTDPSDDHQADQTPCAEDEDCPAPSNLCNGPMVCIQGACFPGKGPAIFDGKQCTDDACDLETGIISHTPVAVDDGDPCTEDACTEGVGITHTAIDSPECAKK